MTIIEQIKAEIERRTKELDEQIVDIYDSRAVLRKDELQKLISLLSDLEKLEKPMQEGLEEEIDRFEDWMETYNQADYPTSYTTRDIARHFAKWGEHNAMEHLRAARRTEEAYQEVAKEMRKQIADNEGLEEEINKAMKSDLCPEEISDYDFCRIARHFAEWGAEHLKK